MNALAAQPLSQLLAVTEEAGKCHGKTCGWMGYFAVGLMFVLLCGGVWLLLQSSFGPLLAYLISGAAFWGCWFVLAIIWFTGVPGFSMAWANAITPGNLFPDVPDSTPRYYGPTGEVPSWEQPSGGQIADLGDSDWIDAEGTQRQGDVDQITGAETAANDIIARHYAEELNVGADQIAVPQVAEITKREFVRDGGEIKYVRLTAGPAKPGETATGEEVDLIEKIKPATFVLSYNRGTVSRDTLIALPLTLGLFAIHLFGLMWYERRYRPITASISADQARERERIPV